jgi:hypothetical protein
MKVASTVRRGAVGKGLLNREPYLAGRLPYSASRHGTVDPCATQEDLSATVLGHQTYPKAKAVRDNSMSGKPRCKEAAKRHARQDPDGKVKAELPEPKCPNCNLSGRKRRMISDCILESQDPSTLGQGDLESDRARSQHSEEAGSSITIRIRTRNGHLNHPERQPNSEREIP